jgi:hypothetical protein
MGLSLSIMFMEVSWLRYISSEFLTSSIWKDRESFWEFQDEECRDFQMYVDIGYADRSC